MKINYTETTSKDARYLLGVTDSFKSVLVEKTVIDGLTTTRSEVLNYLNGKGPKGEPGKQGDPSLLVTSNALPDSDVIDRLIDYLFDKKLKIKESALEVYTHCTTDTLSAMEFRSKN